MVGFSTCKFVMCGGGNTFGFGWEGFGCHSVERLTRSRYLRDSPLSRVSVWTVSLMWICGCDVQGQLVVPLRIREVGREERSAPVKVSISIDSDSSAASRQQQMSFQLTDETDPFFLYTLRVSEEEFQVLKVDQSILVDFSEFPSKFIELLQSCVTAADDDAPKFSAGLVSTTDGTFLSVVETNQFKNLTHLRLEFRAGNDTAVKKYLAKELEKAKGQRDRMQEQLAAQVKNHHESIAHSDETALGLRQELEKATSELNGLRLQHATVSAEMREQSAQFQQEMRVAHESEKRDMSRMHTEREASLVGQAEELRGRLERLEADRSSLQGTSRELATKLQSAEHELSIVREDLTRQREENKASDRVRHEQDKTIQQNAVRLSTLEQQVSDGKDMAAQLTQLVESANAQKSGMEEQLRMMRSTNTSLSDKCKSYSLEVSKANSVIEHLHDELKAAKTKLKVKSAVVMQQEQVVGDKDKTIRDREQTIKGLEVNLSEREGAISILESKLSVADSRIKEAERTLQSNQQVISWLNKEVNDAQMSSRGAYSAALSFRPSFPNTPGVSHHVGQSRLGASSADLSSDPLSRSHARDPLSSYISATTPGPFSTHKAERSHDMSFVKGTPTLHSGATTTTAAPHKVEYNPPQAV